jgi:hypothetical protein
MLAVEALLSQVQQLIKIQEDTRRQVYQNTTLLQQLLSQRQAPDEGQVSGDLFDLPVKSSAEVDQLEAWLTTNANYTALVSFYYRI